MYVARHDFINTPYKNYMKKWIVGFVLIAIIIGESSCIVREKRQPRRHQPRTIVVY